MKYTLFLLLLLTISCEGTDKGAEFKENCPYDLRYSGHFLRVPITISPHQAEYNVGDTIRISTVFSDSIEDLGTQEIFKIENFPFKPLSLLYKFDGNEAHSSGYGPNELQVEDIYLPDSFQSSNYANGYNAKSIYSNGHYQFESQLILKEVGRYLLLFTDVYQDNIGTGNVDRNATADAITFEGKCPTLPYYICSMIDSGDDHLDMYEEELVYLDNEVYHSQLGSIESSIGPLGAGGIRLEWNGGFGFEVVE